MIKPLILKARQFKKLWRKRPWRKIVPNQKKQKKEWLLTIFLVNGEQEQISYRKKSRLNRFYKAMHQRKTWFCNGVFVKDTGQEKYLTINSDHVTHYHVEKIQSN